MYTYYGSAAIDMTRILAVPALYEIQTLPGKPE